MLIGNVYLGIVIAVAIVNSAVIAVIVIASRHIGQLTTASYSPLFQCKCPPSLFS